VFFAWFLYSKFFEQLAALEKDMAFIIRMPDRSCIARAVVFCFCYTLASKIHSTDRLCVGVQDQLHGTWVEQVKLVTTGVKMWDINTVADIVDK
jgi:hypothetical protein